MPRPMDLKKKLAEVEAQIAVDPSETYTVLCYFKAPIMKILLETAVEAGAPGLSQHVVGIINQHFQRQEAQDESQDTIDALAEFWKITPNAALNRILRRLGEPEVLETLLRAELAKDNKVQSIIGALRGQ